MYIKITDTSLQTDTQSKTWLFMAHGRDGSTYSYNTYSPISKKDKRTMFHNLKELVKEGLINTDYWRLV